MGATRRVCALPEMAVSTKTVAALFVGVTAVPGCGTFSAQGWPGLNTVTSEPRAGPPHAPVPGAVCGTVQARHAGCFATMVSTSCSSGAKTTTDPSRYWAAEANSACLRYSGTSPTLAVDGAFDDLGAQRNLAVHRSGSGPPTRTTTKDCSRKRDQAAPGPSASGSTSVPQVRRNPRSSPRARIAPAHPSTTQRRSPAGWSAARASRHR